VKEVKLRGEIKKGQKRTERRQKEGYGLKRRTNNMRP
jgi:hypothetical protein